MSKKSKVTAVNRVERNGQPHSFDGKYGTKDVYSVAFENGDAGEFNTNAGNAPKYKVGDEAEYDITPKDKYPDAITFTSSAYNKSNGGRQMSPEESRKISYLACLKAAADYAAHRNDLTSGQVTKIAQRWLTDMEAFLGTPTTATKEEADKPAAQPAQTETPPAESAPTETPVNDDLPF